MLVLIFGDPLLAPRTIRACGGEWIDLEKHTLAVRDTLFIESGALMRRPPRWKPTEAVFAVGATLEDTAWQNYLARSERKPRSWPRPRTFFLSAAAIRELNRRRKFHAFWKALQGLSVRSWVEPQLRNWFHPRLRVLQVVTSLQVGGAETVCRELSSMSECIGTVAWGAARRTALATPRWDLSHHPSSRKVGALLELARKLHVDLIHTHLLTADENSSIERAFPLMTTMHNVRAGWPKGYDRKRPGYIVACSKMVARDLGPGTPVAWNGVEIKVTRRSKKKDVRSIALVAVANFRKQKRLERLPAIVAALQRQGYATSLTLVGEVHATDPESKRAHQLFWKRARAERVSEKITEVRTLDVRACLARADVFVSTSAYEGLSLAQLEALGAGLPVVATDVGGAAEIRGEADTPAYITLPARARAQRFAEAIIAATALPRKNRLPQAFQADTMKARYRFLYQAALARGVQSEEIWLISNNFSMGGAQSSARRLLGHLHQTETVRAWTLQESRPSNGSLDLRAQGISVENLSGDNPRERSSALIRRCAERRPRAILFWNMMSPEKSLLADALRIPTIDVSPGEMYFAEMDRYLSNPIIDLPIRTAAEYGRCLATAVVKFAREKRRMRDFLGVPAIVIPNGVSGIKPTARTFKRVRVFGSASRIAPHKRLEDLVQVFSKLSVPLLIAGRVEPGARAYYAQLKRMSTPNIQWLGEQDIKKFLPKLDLFVMVSEPAGCPNASLEAMMSGLPLIITDVGGANEQVLPGKNGWLVAPRDAKKMSVAIKSAAELSPARLRSMSRASLRHVTKFSIERMAQSYLKLIKSASRKL